MHLWFNTYYMPRSLQIPVWCVWFYVMDWPAKESVARLQVKVAWQSIGPWQDSHGDKLFYWGTGWKKVENYFSLMDLMAVSPRKRSLTLNQQPWSISLAFKFQQCVAWLHFSRSFKIFQDLSRSFKSEWAETAVVSFEPWRSMKHSVALWGSNAPLGVSVNLLGTVNVFEAVKALCADGVSQLQAA